MFRLTAAAVVVGGLCSWGTRVSTQTPAPDTILHGGKIVTVGAQGTAEAVAIAGGKFVAVGRSTDVLRLRGTGTTVIDLAGRTVIPGLSDNHLHSAGGGPGVDLSRARTLADVYAQLTAHVSKSPMGELVVSNGDWHEAQLEEQRLPLRRDLDKIAPGNPVVLVRGGHEYILNSAALRLYGIDEATKEPAGGRITRYGDGSLNGELVDTARALVRLPPPAPRTLEQRMAAQEAEYKRLHAVGLTSVRHPGVSADDYRMLALMKERGRLTMRVSALLRPAGGLDAAGVTRTLGDWKLRPDDGDERLRIAGVKLAVDGGFEGGYMRTAYAEPWGEGGRFRGLQTVPAARYTAVVRALNQAGWRVFTHAVGDAAIDQVLDAYEAANRDRSILDRRWGVEHAFIGRPDHLPRLRALGAGISAQSHLYVAGPSLVQYWGRERASLVTPMRMYLDGGIPVSSGTDAPVIPFPPLWTIYHFVTRDTITGGRFGPGQAITREEALRSSTLAPAWLTFEERAKGSIEVGKLADLAVLDADILTVPEARIKDLNVLMTMVGGEVVYQDAQFAPTTSPVRGLYNWIRGTGGAERAYAFYRDVFGVELTRSPFAGPAPAGAPPERIRPAAEAASDPLVWDLTDTRGSRFRTVFMRAANTPFGLELSEFFDVPRGERQANPWDPGASRVVFTVRNLDAVVARLKAAGASIVTLGGAPLDTADGRAILVRDPDGYLVEVRQASATARSAAKSPGEVVGTSIGITVAGLGRAREFYERLLGFRVRETRTGAASQLRLNGLAGGTLTEMVTAIPGIDATLVLSEFRLPAAGGQTARPFDWRIQDVGSPQFQLEVTALDALLEQTRAAGYRFVSAGGKPIQRPFGRFVFVKDADGILVEFVEPTPPR
jgi:predicted amidohydrolase YtcJ/catechol 2,3-dioxygenase-like lactoylglutathione lyase family enzyme